MSVEELNKIPVVRFTQNFLENILASPKKRFSLKLGDFIYTFKVTKTTIKKTERE